MNSLFKRPQLLAGLAGVVSYVIFAVGLSGVFNSTFLLFFPLFPVMISAFLLGMRGVYLSLATAILPFAVTQDVYGLVSYLFIVGSAAFIIGSGYNRKTKFGEVEIWAPEGRIITQLITFSILVFIGFSLYLSDTDGGLQGVIIDGYKQALEQLSPELKLAASEASGKMIYIAPVATAATWLIMSVFIAWLAHFTIVSYRLNLRPSFTFRHIDLPTWVLFVVVSFAIIAIFGSGETQYISQVSLALFTFPYAMSGINYVHEVSRKWPNRFFLLAFFYLLLFNLWSFALVAMLGVALHLRRIIRH